MMRDTGDHLREQRDAAAPKEPMKRWTGSEPKQCEVCGSSLAGRPFVDGATKMGPWAKMCDYCHQEVGVGLGVGRGQRYDANRVKVGG